MVFRKKQLLASLGLVVLFIFLKTASVSAQTVTQTLRGRVFDAVTGTAVPNANVVVSEKDLTVAADTEGVFRFDRLDVGRYTLRVSCVGYQPQSVPEVLIQSGKESVLEIFLAPSNLLLDTFEFKSGSAVRKLGIGVAAKLKDENIYRLPAGFNDIGRALNAVPGVASENDGTNHFSVRGLSPNAMQWYLEGAEIVNPNHLPNAGTQSDQSSLNGGGVSIFSMQLLDYAQFYKGNLPVSYGNALGGALDVTFRKGNEERRQTTLSASLIGLDAATEGYFKKGKKASYLVNYRYSTVGLLDKLGVALGDEASTFQDLSFKLNFPTKKAGEFSFFGMGGTSENIFVHKKRDEWETQKDSQDISFRSQMGALGLSHRLSIGKNVNWHTVAVASALESVRSATGYSALELPMASYGTELQQSKIFVRSGVDFKWKRWATAQAGVIFKNEFIARGDTFLTGGSRIVANTEGRTNFFVPYASVNVQPIRQLNIALGARYTYVDFTRQGSFEPSLGVTLDISEKNRVVASANVQSQAVSPLLYFARDGRNNLLNPNRALTLSENMSLAYENYSLRNTVLRVEGFLTRVRNNWGTANETVIDDLTGNAVGQLANDIGTAQTAGVELSINQYMVKGFYWMANATFFDAKIDDKVVAKTRNLRYNNRYAANFGLGKEWTMGSRKNKLFGVGGRYILRGGFWELPIDEVNSRAWGTTIRTGTFTNQMADYARLDLNVYFKRNRDKWHSTLQLDVQNVLNKENIQYYYYDVYVKRVIPKTQLGLIPNLTYRVEF